MNKILITGSQGFIGSYICDDLLKNGYHVVGIDNYSKYGRVVRHHDSHHNFSLIEGNCINIARLVGDNHFDYIINLAAMIGGISYFHKYAYDLLATNERINAAVFDYAIKEFVDHSLNRIIQLSSSMVFERVSTFPTSEDDLKTCYPPLSSYGLQKLASEYFCAAAEMQYGLPFTIIRPFNCVGVGEDESIVSDKMYIGNSKMMMSHVLPDIIHRALEYGPNKPLSILGNGSQVRCYTNGRDIARGVRMAMESEKGKNQNFNISNSVATTVIDLANAVYQYLYGANVTKFIHEKPFIYDVNKRIPNTRKAEKLLGFKWEIPLDESIREVCEWVKSKNNV